jgi:hypothetical protein
MTFLYFCRVSYITRDLVIENVTEKDGGVYRKSSYETFFYNLIIKVINTFFWETVYVNFSKIVTTSMNKSNV